MKWEISPRAPAKWDLSTVLFSPLFKFLCTVTDLDGIKIFFTKTR